METAHLNPTQAPLDSLARVAERYGTPTYAYDVDRLRDQAGQLRQHLPVEIDIYYSLKANASLGICDLFADCGLGADVASAGELVTAIEAGFPSDKIFVAGPWKLPETISLLRSMPDAIVSIDSPSELELLVREGLPHRAVLRLRPDYSTPAVVTAGPGCRFGVPLEELRQCRTLIGPQAANVVGFHVFAGSQVLQSTALVEHFRAALDLSLRAADQLGISPQLLNLGGGFGVPYGPQQQPLDLAPIGRQLAAIVDRAAPARIALELGRYLVAQAGWYLTRVVGHQTHGGHAAVIVDGGTHQRADLCGLCLRNQAYPPTVLKVHGHGQFSAEVPGGKSNAPVSAGRGNGRPTTSSTVSETDVLGCLSLPADVLSEQTALPQLGQGDLLAFPNAGAYGWWASPANFHASPLPAEVAFQGTSIHLMRPRREATSILDDQQHVLDKTAASIDSQREPRPHPSLSRQSK